MAIQVHAETTSQGSQEDTPHRMFFRRHPLELTLDQQQVLLQHITDTSMEHFETEFLTVPKSISERQRTLVSHALNKTHQAGNTPFAFLVHYYGKVVEKVLFVDGVEGHVDKDDFMQETWTRFYHRVTNLQLAPLPENSNLAAYLTTIAYHLKISSARRAALIDFESLEEMLWQCAMTGRAVDEAFLVQDMTHELLMLKEFWDDVSACMDDDEKSVALLVQKYGFGVSAANIAKEYDGAITKTGIKLQAARRRRLLAENPALQRRWQDGLEL